MLTTAGKVVDNLASAEDTDQLQPQMRSTRAGTRGYVRRKSAK